MLSASTGEKKLCLARDPNQGYNLPPVRSTTNPEKPAASEADIFSGGRDSNVLVRRSSWLLAEKSPRLFPRSPALSDSILPYSDDGFRSETATVDKLRDNGKTFGIDSCSMGSISNRVISAVGSDGHWHASEPQAGTAMRWG